MNPVEFFCFLLTWLLFVCPMSERHFIRLIMKLLQKCTVYKCCLNRALQLYTISGRLFHKMLPHWTIYSALSFIKAVLAEFPVVFILMSLPQTFWTAVYSRENTLNSWRTRPSWLGCRSTMTIADADRGSGVVNVFSSWSRSFGGGSTQRCDCELFAFLSRTHGLTMIPL